MIDILINVLIGMGILILMLAGIIGLVAGGAFIFDRWFYGRLHAPEWLIKLGHAIFVTLVLAFVLVFAYTLGQGIMNG